MGVIHEMKMCYICHPLRGIPPYTEEQVQQNIKKITAICQRLANDTDIIPISPIHTFAYLDPLTYDADKGMRNCLALLDSCSELWVFGDWETSEGCMMELRHARKRGIPVRYFWSGINDSVFV